jgi:hypothetical protein
MDDRQPRSTGELLSDALSLFRRHFKLLYSLALPFCAVDLIIREAGQSALQTMRAKLEQDPSGLDVDALLGMLAAGAGGIGLILASAVLVQVLAAGLVTLTSQAWHQRVPALGDAMNAVVSRAAALVGTSLLFFLAIFGLLGALMVLVVAAAATGSVALIVVASLLALAGMVLALIFLTLRWGVYTQTVVLENRFGPGAFARSTELMAGRGVPFFESAKLRLSLLFLITFAIGGTLQSLFAVPRLMVAFATGWDVADGMPPLASMPMWFIVPFGLMEVLTNALVVPFSSVLMTLFYFDLRVRFEGYDLAPAPAETANTSA